LRRSETNPKNNESRQTGQRIALFYVSSIRFERRLLSCINLENLRHRSENFRFAPTSEVVSHCPVSSVHPPASPLKSSASPLLAKRPISVVHDTIGRSTSVKSGDFIRLPLPGFVILDKSFRIPITPLRWARLSDQPDSKRQLLVRKFHLQPALSYFLS
jgi:hypothetical protein